MKRDGDKLRSARERRAIFERLVLPVLGARQIDAVKRSEIVRLLDKIEDESGPHTAHLVLAIMPSCLIGTPVGTTIFSRPLGAAWDA
jgi:hypothetical protein